MSLTKSDHIRRLLERNLDTPAAQIQETLANRGIEVTSGLIHVVKSQIRKQRQEEQAQREREQRQREAVEAQRQREAAAEKARQEQEKLRMEQEQEKVRKEAAAKSHATKQANTKPLRQYVAEVLAGNTEGLTANDIAEKVKAAGYVSNTEFFSQGLHKKLRLMVLNGEVVKGDSGTYMLKPTEVATPAPAVAAPAVAPVAAVASSVNGLVGPDMIDPKLLVEVNRLVSRVGGASRLRTYVTTLEELQQGLTQPENRVS